MNRRWIFVGALLSLMVLGGCSSDDDPTYPMPKLSTELTVAFDEIVQGESVDAMITFSATTEENVEISYNHSMFLGYRVTSAGGELLIEFPREVFGEVWDYVVRPGGWYLRASINVPTARANAEVPNRFTSWLSTEEVLPEGEYILKAGLYGREHRYPWGEVRFTVLSTPSNP